MTRNKLSEMYALATMRIHAATSMLYEALHDSRGNPIQNPDAVREIVAEYKREVIEEIVLVNDAVSEFSDECERKS